MKKLVAVLLIAPFLSIAGCGDDTVGPSSIHGTYSLTAVDGVEVPAPYGTAIATGGQTTLASDGNWNTLLELQGTEDLTNAGTYDFVDGTVTFFDQFNASFGGIIRGDTLTVAGGSNTLVYVK